VTRVTSKPEVIGSRVGFSTENDQQGPTNRWREGYEHTGGAKLEQSEMVRILGLQRAH